jgi:hypothetical protein
VGLVSKLTFKRRRLMVWITRDFDITKICSPYRIFGKEPVKAYMVNYDGEVQEYFTWTLPGRPYTNKSKGGTYSYGPLSNTENTAIAETDSPIYLEPGEGPVEIDLVLKTAPKARLFEGQNI